MFFLVYTVLVVVGCGWAMIGMISQFIFEERNPEDFALLLSKAESKDKFLSIIWLNGPFAYIELKKLAKKAKEGNTPCREYFW